jgi:hypothetical protein
MNVILPNVILPNAILPNVILPNVILPNGIVLNVRAPCGKISKLIPFKGNLKQIVKCEGYN